MKKSLCLQFQMFFVFIGSIMSFSGAIMHAAQLEVKEAAAEMVVPSAPTAPSPKEVKNQLKQSQHVPSFVSSLIREAARPIPEKSDIVTAQEEEKKEAADQGEAVDLSRRTLLIFNDNDEIHRDDKNPFVTCQAVVALSQKAGPILITGALLSHIFNRDSNHTQNTKDILQAFYTDFDATEWLIYRLNSLHTFFLLIPQKDLKSMSDFNIKDTWVKINCTKQDSLQAYFTDENKKEYEYFKNSAQNPNLSQDFLSVFKQLFSNKINKTHWVIYLIGHGDYGKSIAGLSINGEKSEFKQLLDVLDKKIKTKLFVYNSCYAAGFNANQVYGELKYISDMGAQSQQPILAHARPTQNIHTYPFTIVTAATTDAVTATRLPEIRYIYPDRKDTFGILSSNTRYDLFIHETQKEPINYPVALGYLFPLITGPARFNEEITSIPQIRPANSPAWFPLVDYDKAVIRIGNVMAKTRVLPLKIKLYTNAYGNKHDPKAILLATENVPFPIEIDANIQHIPPVISLIPGEATHRFKLITQQNHSLDDFIQKTGSVEYGAHKTFDISTSNGALCIFTKNGVFNLFQGSLEKYKIQETLFEGADEGDATMVHKALASGIDPNTILTTPLRYQDDIGRTALHIAADQGSTENKGHAEVIRILVQRGADINGKDSEGNAPLHYAAGRSQIGAVNELIKQKAMINIKNNYGDTPLHNVTKRLIEQEGDENNFNKAKNVIQLLIDAKADTTIKNKNEKTAIDMLKDADVICACARTIDEAFLFKGALDGDAAMVQRALDSGVKPNTMLTMPIGSESDSERTGLHIAADRSTENEGHAEVIRILLEKGAAINSKDSEGNTPLHKAIGRLIQEQGDKARFNKAKNAIQLLIGAKADTAIKNNDGKTALDMLKEAGINSPAITQAIDMFPKPTVASGTDEQQETKEAEEAAQARQ
ncbi:MAG: ankyrin repeat domain-containing protein [Candidatus Dependentiae bacterium]|nr:ankyrin repeat domain-containing protein [Candidatus Dependentiae bacterium]